MAINEKSIRVKDDGSITAGGKTYKNKAAYKSRNTRKSNVDAAKKKPYKMVPDNRSGRHSKKKVYAKDSMFPKAREDARRNTAKPQAFGSAFKSARAAGKDKFLWKGKSYHTKTKAELEKKTGASEKDRFERKGKSNQTAKKRSFLDKIKSKFSK